MEHHEKEREHKSYKSLNAVTTFYKFLATEQTICLNATRLFEELSMSNCNYSVCRNNIVELSDLLEVDTEELCDFFNHTNTHLKSALETALKNLDKKRLISWENIRMVFRNRAELELNELGEVKIINGQVQANVYSDYEIATTEEDNLIRDTERKILLEMGLNDIGQVYLYKKESAFYKRVQEEIQQSTNILYYFKSYKIRYNKEYVQSELERMEKKRVNRNSLNSKVQKNLIENATKRHINARDLLKNDNGIDENKIYYIEMRAKKQYIKNTKKTISTVIANKSTDIRSKIAPIK